MPDRVHTLCPYCGVGCGLVATASEGRLVGVEGDPIHPVNRGKTCRKPLELASAVHAPDRATVPLLRERRDLRFREAGWDEAIGRLSGRLREIVAEHGPRAVAFYISGQLLTEDYYAVNKLAKGFIGTNNVDSNSRLCMSSAVAGYSGAFGFDGPPPSYADIGLADCLLLLGTNTAACHPIVWSRVRERRSEGACVICVDPRPTQTAKESTLHLPVRPGTDLALLSAMLHVLERDGLLDEAFIARSTSGWEQAREVAREWSPQRAAEVCGIEAALIEEAAQRFGSGPRSMALWSMGANQSRVGTLKNRALINLCLASGQIGRPGTGPLSLTGQPNAMGGRETGGLAHLLPGYRRVDSPEDRAEMERYWRIEEGGAGISPEPGLAAVDLFDAVRDGEVKALWVVATNPAVSLPDSGRAREALEAAELLVVQDAHHPTETGALADAVLPAAAWPEKQGTMTNSERRVGLVRGLLEPAGEALPDWEIFARLGRALGYGEHFAWEGPEEVFAEFAACTAGRPCDLSGISHERLAREGSVQWPCPSPHSEGTERLYETARFPTADGRARFAPTPQAAPAEEPDGDYPLILTTGRVAEHWHTMSRTGKSSLLNRLAPEPLVELSLADAERIGVEEGSRARIVSRRGEMVMRVTIVEGGREGVAFVPFHWGSRNAPAGGGQANAATNPVVDPVSKQPELKAAAVRIEPVAETAVAARPRPATRPRRLVVIGTGMAGLETVQELRNRAPEDAWRVTMLGEEPGTPYNRILLSKLLAGETEVPALELRSPDWFARRGIDLRGGCPAREIDVTRQRVTDATGCGHDYDALVVATGSRPFVPPISGVDDPRVLAFRTTADVRAIESAAGGARRAAVIGGGLLGLEAAAGLRRHELQVTVVEAAPHLMPQQLDPAAAAMLAKALEGLGIRSVCGVSAERCGADGVTLRGGEEIEADMTVVAAGVRPETSLAREAGIEVGRGVLVDGEMRTSAPSVWAVGECAEHDGTVYGLWAPVAAQARVAGASVAGDAAVFQREVPATNLKVAGVSLFAGGADGEEGDELVWIDGRRGVYRRLVLEGDRLAAATLLGDVSGARELSSLLRSGEAAPEELLAPPGGATAPRAPEPADLICSCNAVNRGQIEAAIGARDLRSVAEVGRETRAGTGCGSCQSEIEAILREREAAREQDSSTRNRDVTVAKRGRPRIPA
ncbi:MAG TPA: molybdopterin-dependent oxidoreductase [Solirubrobacterales bacterium]|nr:molybdopterin-dependent oxidoreductase [Solirubrobacterales bacterium]